MLTPRTVARSRAGGSLSPGFLAVCDRTYLGGDLEIEEVGAVLFVHLDTNQCTSNTSSLVNRWLA